MQILLDLLGIQINMRVPSGLSSGYMVGGRDECGKIVANELTEMCIRVVDDIRLVYPSVGLCYTEEMPESYLEIAARLFYAVFLREMAKKHIQPILFVRGSCYNESTMRKGSA